MTDAVAADGAIADDTGEANSVPQSTIVTPVEPSPTLRATTPLSTTTTATAGGPHAGGWRHIRGCESTWSTLDSLLTAMSLAVLLGVIPYEMGFLEIIELIVDTRLPEGMMRP